VTVGTGVGVVLGAGVAVGAAAAVSWALDLVGGTVGAEVAVGGAWVNKDSSLRPLNELSKKLETRI